MNWKKLNLLTVSLLLLTCFSCREDEKIPCPEGRTRVARFSLRNAEAGEVTRSSLSTDFAVSWKTSDVISYFTGKTSVSEPGVKHFIIPSDKTAGASVSMDVTYKDGDENVVFFTKGSGTGDASTADFSKIVIEGGVPSEQTGEFSKYHIGVAKASLSSNTAEIAPVQAYISFSMSKLDFSAKEVDKIEITTGGTTPGSVCGDMTINNPGTATSTINYGTGTKITINREKTRFTTGTTYYVAVNATTSTAKYPNGLKFTMYSAGVEVGNVFVKNNVSGASEISVKKGEILELGDIYAHKSITYRNPALYPTKAATTWQKGKELWLHLDPEDCSCQMNSTITEGFSLTYLGMEPLEGVGNCKHYKVDVTKAEYKTFDDENTCTVTFTLKEKDRTGVDDKELKCDISFGKYFDLGCKHGEMRCLWGTGFVKGNLATGYTMLTDDTAEGGYYGWANVDEAIPYGTTGYVKNLWVRWGSPAPSSPNQETFVGTKYATHGTIQKEVGEWEDVTGTYDRIDDICVLGGFGVTPSVPDLQELLVCTKYTKGAGYDTYKSRITGYTDMEIHFAYRQFWHIQGRLSKTGRGCASNQLAAPGRLRTPQLDLGTIALDAMPERAYSYRPVKYVE